MKKCFMKQQEHSNNICANCEPLWMHYDNSTGTFPFLFESNIKPFSDIDVSKRDEEIRKRIGFVGNIIIIIYFHNKNNKYLHVARCS